MGDLMTALHANRAEIARALPKAEADLARCRAECNALAAAIGKARLILKDLSPDGIAGSPRPLTLHEAMALVLREYPDGLAAGPLADEVDGRGLYRRRDGKPAGGGQVHARVQHYPALFVRDQRRIRLRHADDPAV